MSSIGDLYGDILSIRIEEDQIRRVKDPQKQRRLREIQSVLQSRRYDTEIEEDMEQLLGLLCEVYYLTMGRKKYDDMMGILGLSEKSRNKNRCNKK